MSKVSMIEDVEYTDECLISESELGCVKSTNPGATWKLSATFYVVGRG